MDQKRMLWIVAAVGIFLLVVIGAALILFAPDKASDPVMASIRDNQTRAMAVPAPQTHSSDIPSDQSAYSQTSSPTADNSQSQLPSSVQDLTVVSGNTTIYSDRTTYAQQPEPDGMSRPPRSSHMYGSQTAPQPLTPQQSYPSTVTLQVNPVRIESVTTQNTPASSPSNVTYNNSAVYENQVSSARPAGTVPAAAQQNVKPYVSESAPSAQNSAQSAAQSSAKKAAAVKTASAKTASVKPAAAKPAAAKASPAAVKKAVEQTPSYWVQAASFSSKKNAEEARAVLAAEKIPAEIFTYTDVKNTTFYRVRVGPYMTKDEAEYWKTRISIIDQFSSSSSYITNSAQPAAKK